MTPPPDPSGRPRLAIVANAPSPYRVHQHTRIARELPEAQLFSVFKHEKNNQDYTLDLPKEIGPVVFGQGEPMIGKNSPGRALKQWARGGEITRWLASNDIDAVILTGYNDLGLFRVIRWCAKNKIPCFMFSDSNVHGDKAKGLGRAFKNLYVPWVVKKLTGLMPCGTKGQAFYDRYGGKKKPVFFMPHEPDYLAIDAVTEPRVQAMRDEYDLDPTRRYINFTARLAQVKRPDLLIDAFARIAKDRPEWDLLMVGAGPLEGQLRERVPKELIDRVRWVGFQDGIQRLAALYKCSDVYVLPSDYEPWAVTVLEACACGLAMVSSDVVGAAAEVVIDGVNGRQFRAGSVDSLTQALLDVTDPEKVEKYKAASAGVLADWRRRGDPVEGVRNALRYARLLPGKPTLSAGAHAA
ncbi:MAG: glycosyltransferase family 4 protein [Phycisphaerales bacterium]